MRYLFFPVICVLTVFAFAQKSDTVAIGNTKKFKFLDNALKHPGEVFVLDISESLINTVDPQIGQFYERQAVAFSVIDSCEGDSARVDYAGKLNGVVRPLLDWSTVLSPESI